MAVGITITGSLADSLETIIDEARVVREFPGPVPKLAERHRLGENEGLDWNEIAISQFVAQNITETTTLNNPQQYADTLLTITPTVTGITTIVTDRTYRRISEKVVGQLGGAAQAAIERKKDEDGLATLDGATIALGATATPVEFSDFAHAVDRVGVGDLNEPSNSPIYGVLHPYHLTDIKDQITAGIGTYAVPDGMTEDTFKQGFKGTLGGANIFEDGNIPLNQGGVAADANSYIFARFGLLLIEGHSLRNAITRREDYGGGADQLFMYDEYEYGERLAAATTGAFLAEILGDATAPA